MYYVCIFASNIFKWDNKIYKLQLPFVYTYRVRVFVNEIYKPQFPLRIKVQLETQLLKLGKRV